jgi:uncharacterized RDD family membrane protein YckC
MTDAAEPAILGMPGLATSEPPAATHARPDDETARPSPVPRSRSAPTTVSVAGFWRRAAAAAVDAGAILPVSILLTWFASALAGIHLPPGSSRGFDFWLDLLLTSDPAVMTALIITLAVTSIYLFVFQATVGQTLGMRVLKLRVIDAYGDPPTYLRAGLRTAGNLVSIGTLFLGFLWIGFDAEKRGLHDWIAGTYVIRAT